MASPNFIQNRGAEVADKGAEVAGAGPAGSFRAAASIAFRPESLLRPGDNCCAVARAHRAALLVDGEVYFRAFYQAAQRATRSIFILGWDFHSRTRLHFDDEAEAKRPDGWRYTRRAQRPPAVLGDFLNFLVRRRRGLHIHVLVWDYPMLFGIDREFPPHYGFGWTPRRRVRFLYDNTHPLAGSHHQKIVMIDDALAFTGGFDLTACRWDTPAHQPDDPRRVDANCKVYAPFHDMMLAVDGEAARALGAIVRQRWRLATGKELPRLTARADPWPAELRPEFRDIDIGIARTMPPGEERPAVREVEKLYLDMIGAARRTVYIENQYFTSQRLANAIGERLAEADGPEIILVLRLMSHGWLEEHTMHVLRSSLIKQLRAADRHGRFHVYYPHVDGLAAEKCIDIHSKLMIVDDDLLRIGSANLCNRSMGMDTECDVLIEARGDPNLAQKISQIRSRLLAEHTGTSAEEVKARLAQGGPLHEAIGRLGSPARCMKRLEDLPEWSEAIVNVASIADPPEPISVEGLTSDLRADTGPAPGAPAWNKLLLIALAIAALAAAWRYTPLADWITPEKVRQWAHDFADRRWAPFAILLAYTPAAFVMFPRPLITMAAVLAFGPWLGFGYSFAGIALAALATYAAGVVLDSNTVRRLAGRRMEPIIRVLRKRGLVAILLLRLVPIAPFAVEGVVAGAIRISLGPYMLGSMLGMLPGMLTATVFGDQLRAALGEGGNVNFGLLAAVGLVFAVGTWLVTRWFRRTEKKMSAERTIDRERLLPADGQLGRQPR